MTKYINIFKNSNKQEGSQQPDYSMSISEKMPDGSYNNKDVGACWLKPMKDGNKYLSCALKEANERDGVKYAGFSITEDAALPQVNEVAPEITDDQTPF